MQFKDTYTNLRRRANLPILACALTPLLTVNARAADGPNTESADRYWISSVQPLLDKKCLKCHAGVRQQGGLDLRSLETILRGGDSGPEISPGKPAASRLLQYVSPPSGPHMPPDKAKQFSPAEINVVKTWIAGLPIAKSKLATGDSTNNAWVQGYLADYRIQTRSHEIPPSNLSASRTIDWFLETDWKHSNAVPTAICADNTFVRRIYLDIAGRIPTRAELTQFMADRRPNRRNLLIDRLLLSDDYARHMREVFDTVLMRRPNANTAKQREDSGWYSYLERSFRTNWPWNEMVRDILVARPQKPSGGDSGAEWFLAERQNNYQTIAEAVAPIVYGKQIACAQCHNHPLAWEVEQRHYWGLVAVFNRSSNVNTKSGVRVAESAIGGFVNFANLKKESQPASLVFINGTSVKERVPGPNEKEVDSPDLYLIPPPKKGEAPESAAVPKLSRREEFADAATHDNPMLAKAFVNRMWANLMGRGIVQPVDQIDSRHYASHPELLDWLALNFEKTGYNVQGLVRDIVCSRAYQLDSKQTPGKYPTLPEQFARGLEKPLSGEQLYRSLVIAAGEHQEPKSDTERKFITTFPDLMPETYSPSLQQALFLTNSPLVAQMLKPATHADNTAAHLVALKSADARIHEAFLTVLGRSPDAIERQQCIALLAHQTVEKGVEDLLWALVSGSEFRVNH